METVDKWNRWANAHTNIFTDGLRILFGAFIMIKGYFFLDQTDYLYSLFKSVSGQGTYFVILTMLVRIQLGQQASLQRKALGAFCFPR